ncbi:response regulator [Zavarzinia compransoris]|uniref:DNA-binding response regulator n=1 Tax=Zavarzinia compransoris TaxID=1264899 RepID=A0A317DWI1_9PROT|nr:response regulator transcription factor [Zavarzinia compransoris]PWR18704.1 DNA-binding response regulator [Zavarzinia compransoris]TDP48683.1 LuxR family two component transcriptional regulator [Zavarzinia compransoris]
MLKVLIADDHPLFRDALHGAVTAVRADALVVEAASLAGVLDLVQDDDDLDLALLDLRMPGMDGLAGLVMLRKVKPELPVAIVSALADEDTVARCLACGAAGYIPKSLGREKIRAAIETVLAGGIFTPDAAHVAAATRPVPKGRAHDEPFAKIGSLTPQQMRVLELMGEGRLNKEISHILSVSETTVKAHVSAVLHKLGVASRTQAVLALRRMKELQDAGA